MKMKLLIALAVGIVLWGVAFLNSIIQLRGNPDIIPAGKIEETNFMGERVKVIKQTNGFFLVKYPTGIPASDPKHEISAKIEEIKWLHNRMTELSRDGIRIGYALCQGGGSLSNYMAQLEADWQKLLQKNISEASKAK